MGVLVAVVAVMMLVVVPALASQAGPISESGIVPTVVTHTGGDWVADCSAVASEADSGIWINNPRTDTYTSDTGVVVDLKVYPDYPNLDEQQFYFDLAGARALDVIVKGGVDSNWYHYNPAAKNDTGLGAPEEKRKTATNLSHISFCFDTSGGSISGLKWRDHNNDGTEDSFERGLAGWTIKAFDTEGTEAGSAITAADGTYTISGLTLDQTYTVCEFAPVEAKGYRGWIQSIPDPSTADCSGYLGAEPTGYSVDLAGDVQAMNFFNVRTITIPSDPDVQIACGTLPEGGIFTVGDGVFDPIGTIKVDPDNCKPGEYVFETWVDGSEQFAEFYPAFNAGGLTMPLVENYTWVITGTNEQHTLYYDDSLTADPTDDKPMLFCERQWSPGDPITSDVLPSGETSCLLETFEQATSDGIHRTDTVFTLADGRRTLR